MNEQASKLKEPMSSLIRKVCACKENTTHFNKGINTFKGMLRARVVVF